MEGLETTNRALASRLGRGRSCMRWWLPAAEREAYGSEQAVSDIWKAPSWSPSAQSESHDFGKPAVFWGRLSV